MWFRKGKNLFNINDIVTSVYIETNGLTGNSSVSNTSGFIKVSKGNLTLSYEYTTLLNVGTRAYVFYDNNKSVLSGGTYLNSNKITKLSCPQDGYLRFSYDKNVNNIQLEYGDNKTAYEAYIEPKIFIKDDNNIYEEFTKKQEENYSEQERIIGTWIDGKPLYRKTLNVKLDDNNYGDTGVPNGYIADNIKEVTNIYGTMEYSNIGLSKIPINSYIDTTHYSSFYYYSTSKSLRVFLGKDLAGLKAIINVEYTKTTD